MTEAWSMTKTELKLFLRDPMAVFFTLLFPLMMLFLFGSIFGNKPDPDLGGRGSVDVSVPGYIAIIIATNAIMGLPINLATYRAGGVLRRFRATPLRPAVVLGAQVAVGLVFAAVSSALLVVAGRIFFGLHLPENPEWCWGRSFSAPRASSPSASSWPASCPMPGQPSPWPWWSSFP